MRYFITLPIALLAGTVSASDIIPGSPSEVATVTYDWAGTYAGLSSGYGWMDGYFVTSGYPPANDDLDGGIFGGFAGVNTQLDGNVVLGLEGDLDYNTRNVTIASSFGTFAGGVDWQGSARVRLGYALDRLLIYTSAGWAAAHLEADFIGVAQATESFHGYTLGAGIDYAVTDRIFGRIDYRYNDFGSGKLDFGAAAIDAELDQHSVKVGVGIKF